MTDKYIFRCVDCDAELAVEWSAKLNEIYAQAKEAGWSILKGWARCDEHNPVTLRTELIPIIKGE